MKIPVRFFLIASLSIGADGCTPDQEVSLDPADLAAAVTIHRDSFGVPHVNGKTDAAAAFGFAYAQAEDNFWQLEDNFIRAIGRASEVYESETLASDWVNRALRIEELSILEFEQSDAALKALLVGYAEGLNHFLASNPDTETRLLDHFEPWYPLAFIRYLYYQRGFVRSSGLSGADVHAAMATSRRTSDDVGSAWTPESQLDSLVDLLDGNSSEGGDLTSLFGLDRAVPENLGEQGSNSWAVAPALSTSGNALLFINPHLPFFGPSQVYEGHVLSDEGWNFSGYTRFGFPLPYVGFNENLGWASTDNGADLSDLYFESFEDDTEALVYRYGDERRTAEEWTAEISVKSMGSVESSSYSMRRTHHGPVVGLRNGRPLALKMAKFEEPGWLAQWYAMTRSRTFDEFYDAVSRLDMMFGNYTYADQEGNILFTYNGAVPVRSESFDWTYPLDGSDPETEWMGYHPMDEIPQVLNPESGWIQNCNGSPFLTTANDNPSASDFPKYMVREGSNARTRAARRILSGHDTFTFDEWTELSYSTFVIRAEETIPDLVEDWEDLRQQDAVRAERLREAVELLRDWDRISTIDSEAMTLFVHAGEYSSSWLRRLELAMSELESDWGSWRVPWGEVNRLQRVQSKGVGFSDARPSIATAGVPGWAGAMYTIYTETQSDTKKRYGTAGGSYVSVVEFGPKVHARTLHTFGASADPDSPHHFDQAPLYATGAYKEAWLTLEDVVNNAERSYHPGESPHK